MSKFHFSTRQIAAAGLIGALYAVMSYFAAIFGVAFGPIQFRFSAALCVLPFLIPAAAPGLFVGCVVANLLSPYGVLDMVFGPLATLLAAVLTMKCPNRWLASLPPVVCNMVIVGAVIAFEETGFTAAFPAAFAWNAFTVGLGEAAVCFLLGQLLLSVLTRVRSVRALSADG